MTPPTPLRFWRLQLAARVAGLAATAVGVAHLVAWLQGSMASLGAMTITMKTNASVCVALAGLVLSLLASESPSRISRLTARLAALVVLSLATLTLIEHLGGVDLGIDQLLADEAPGAAAVVAPNRMGPPASLSFVLLGTALLVLATPRLPRWRTALYQSLAGATVVVALFPVIGYLYGASELYGVARFTGIAWPTAVCILGLAIGVLLSRPRSGVMAVATAEGPGGVLIRRLLPAAILFPLGLGWLRVSGERGSWFDPATGTSLVMLVMIVTYAVAVVVGGRWVSRSESALRASEEATRRQLAETQAIYDSAHVGLCVLDRDLRFLRVNRRLAEFNGIPAEDHLGKSVEEIVPSLAPFARETADRIFRSGVGVTDVEFTGGTASGPDPARTWIEQWLPLKTGSGDVVAINVVVEEVTERKRAEEVLRKSEERFRALVRASSQVLYSMSPDWSEMLTLQGGDHPADAGTASPDWLQEYVHADDRGAVLDAINRAVGEERVFELEHRVRRSDGTFGWIASRAVPVRDEAGKIVEWFGAASDITRRREAEEALRHSENRLSTALAIAALGIWEYEVQPDLCHLDERCREVFGVTDDRPLSIEEILQRIHPDDRPRVRLEVSEALDPSGTGLYDTDYRILRPDGAERWVAVRGHAVPSHRDDPAVRFVGTVMDITERKRTEEALREANARLAEADRRKDEFIAILSHELRNPLAPIRYALPLLEREAQAESAARAIAVINRQVDHLARLVDDFLDVSRITRGQIELRREDVTVDSLVKMAVEAASPAIVAGRHVLTLALPDEPIWVHVDPKRLSQVLTNLLNNAAKYTPSGGQITVAVEPAGEHVLLRVRDTGMGIEADAMPALFEMFRQIKRASRPQGGLGIGLALAKRLVEMHGGTIDAHSEGAGRGSEFVVGLPVGAVGRTNEVEAGEPGGRVMRPLRVLVVDDNADLVQMLAAMLESSGHHVRKALDGRSAVAIARAFRPDVVLLDLGLPEMDGLEVARQLRRFPETADTHLVALTGWGQAQDRQRTREAGFNHHLTKPTQPETLERLLAELTSQMQARHRM